MVTSNSLLDCKLGGQSLCFVYFVSSALGTIHAPLGKYLALVNERIEGQKKNALTFTWCDYLSSKEHYSVLRKCCFSLFSKQQPEIDINSPIYSLRVRV